MAGRTTHARAILGPELYEKMTKSKILLVGAGGIGCELIKDVVLTGFGDITLLDLDTIDLSNLNRQFLFRKKDVKQSKALTAAATVHPFNPNVKITPIHGNIKDSQFDVAWFCGFDIVLNALDNIDARTHVNKMCMAAGVPLVESGTAGYMGQVQPIVKDESECFSCNPHETPKSFPVCTIRSTPSQPIHCIVWAKSYLMSQLFAEDENASSSTELDEALKAGSNAEEIATLKAEAQAFSQVRSLLRNGKEGENAARVVFEKIFNTDLRNLLKMEDMWKSRAPPTPLDWDGIMTGAFDMSSAGLDSNNNTSNTPGGKLKDQKPLTLKENLELFIDSTKRLSVRLKDLISSSKGGAEPTITFDKDHDDTLDFVTAAANLRGTAYGIDGNTRWEVKEMAGNIIPAIATTNAIIAGIIVLQALHILAGTLKARQSKTPASFERSRKRQTNLVPDGLVAYSLGKPKNGCAVCRDTYVILKCDPERTTLGEAVTSVFGIGEDDLPEISTYESARLLSDPDWDDNLSRTLSSLGVMQGKFLTIVDDSDGDDNGMIRDTIQLAIVALPLDHPSDSQPYLLPTPLPTIPMKPKPVSSIPDEIPESPVKVVHKKKRPLSSSDLAEPATKKRRVTPMPMMSPKKKRFEEDGLVLLDGLGDDVDMGHTGRGDVIELD